jgi:hypothetical protein
MATRAVETWEAIARYRASLVRRGSAIDLRVLGVDLPPIQVDNPGRELIALTAKAGSKKTDEVDLSAAIIRRSRVVLTGLPGAGKSTAMDQLAALWAKDDDGPIPLIVKLPTFADLLRNQDPDNALIDAALWLVPPPDRKTIELEIRRRLSRGRVALFLDGLDETREQRYAVVKALGEIMGWIHPDVECVLTTRDVAYGAAQTLGWQSLRLSKPRDLKTTIRRLAGLLADEGGIANGDRELWIDARTEWVEQQTRRITALAEVPIFAILLMILAAKHRLDEVPSSRAALLSLAVDDLVDRVEAGRAVLRPVPSLPLTEKSSLLKRAFDEIGHLVLTEGAVQHDQVEVALARQIATDWGLPPAKSQALAAEAWHFWDEAGVFVAEGPRQVLRARLSLLAEVAEARWISRQGAVEIAAWTHGVSKSERHQEALALAAELSELVLDALIDVVASEPDALTALVAIRAARDRRAPSETLDRLVKLVLRLIPQLEVKTCYQIATALVETQVPIGDRRHVVRTLSARLPRPNFVVVRALAALAWEADSRSGERALIAVIRLRNLDQMVKTEKWGVDEAYARAVIAAARLMLPRRPSLAAEVGRAMKRGSMTMHEALAEILKAQGRSDIVRRADAKLTREMTRSIGKMLSRDTGWSSFLEILTQGPGRQMSWSEERRMDELADLLGTLDLNDRGAWDMAVAVKHDPRGLREILDSFIYLGNFDRLMLSAQASTVLSIQEWHASLDIRLFLFDAPTRRPLDWRDDAERDWRSRRIVDLLASKAPLVRELASDLLVSHPVPGDLVPLIEAVLPGLTVPARLNAAQTLLALTLNDMDRARDWAVSPDPILRGLGGRRLMYALLAGLVEPSEVMAVLGDRDLWVRQSALAPAKTIPPSLIEKIGTDGLPDPVEWTCTGCGSLNGPPWKACHWCSGSPPGISTEIRKQVPWPDMGGSYSVLTLSGDP